MSRARPSPSRSFRSCVCKMSSHEFMAADHFHMHSSLASSTFTFHPSRTQEVLRYRKPQCREVAGLFGGGHRRGEAVHVSKEAQQPPRTRRILTELRAGRHYTWSLARPHRSELSPDSKAIGFSARVDLSPTPTTCELDSEGVKWKPERWKPTQVPGWRWKWRASPEILRRIRG